MAAITLTTLTSIDGDTPSEAAMAYACGWRIDADHWWVRPLRAGDPREPPSDGYVRDGHVFAAYAGAALGFDRGDLAPEREERHPLASRAEQCHAKAMEFEVHICAATPESEKLQFQYYAQLWHEMGDFWEALAKRKRD